MDSDPWNWSVQDVQHFFRHGAHRYIDNMPHSRLPPLEPFLDALNKNDVNGAALLITIDSGALRDECGVTSFSTRAAVCHCITKLRKLSAIYASQYDLPEPRTPASLPASLAERVFVSTQAPQEVAPPNFAVGEHIRPGEGEIEDARGRKRRKLDLSNVEPAQEANQTSGAITAADKSGGYLGDSAISIDELFYGCTDFGEEVKELRPVGDMMVLNADRVAGLEEDNFQFIYQNKPAGESEFVYSQMRHVLKDPPLLDLRRNGRDALGILPYRDRFEQKQRSATVLQFTHDAREPVAVRENAAHLEHGYVSQTPSQQSEGEWAFLTHKYNAEEDDVLPLYGDSEHGDAEVSSSTADTNEEEEACEEEGSADLNADRIAEIIEDAVKECVNKWLAGLPKYEEKHAWTIWNKIKRSRTLREVFIEGAQARIEHFTTRLNKLKDELLESTWETEQSLVKACGNLEPTIEEREKQRWMVTIWKKNKEPPHLVRQGTHSTKPTQKTWTNKEREPGLRIHPDDRFSVSPASVVDEEAANGSEGDLREAHKTPSGAEEEIIYEGDDEEAVDAFRSHTNIPDASLRPDVSAIGSMDHSDADECTEHDVLDADTEFDSALKLAALEARSRMQDQDHNPENPDLDSEELPSPSTFLSSCKHNIEPKTPSKVPSSFVDLTGLSSDSSLPRKRGRGRPASATKKPDLSDPTSATVSEVASWDLSELVKESDRRRILIRLLYDAGSKIRDEIDERLKSLGRSMFQTQLHAAVALRTSGNTESQDSRKDGAEKMFRIAEIYRDWMLPLQRDKASWDTINASHIELFSAMLQGVILKKSTRLFIQPEKASSKPKSLSTPIFISSSGEDEEPNKRDTPHSKRKRLVRRSKTAEKSRNMAIERQKRFEESQPTDPTRLAAMIEGDSNDMSIEINPAKAEDSDIIYVCERVAGKIKKHQIDGVRFLWREITAEGEEGGQGCILAHTMGLGKTMQTIAVLAAVGEAAQSKKKSVYGQLPESLRLRSKDSRRRYLRVLVLCPAGLITNWCREIDQWAPEQLGSVFSLDTNSKVTRVQRTEEWMRHGGLLLVGYEMFRSLLSAKARKNQSNTTLDAEVARMEEILLEGSEIVVADEAHKLKNAKSSIGTVTKRFRTESRIALTGTPMSNDVGEIYALVSWVAPGFLGDPQEFRAHYQEPIEQGLYHDSTPYERRKSIKKLKVLQAEIEPKVNRANIEVLRGSLKPKIEYVITVALTPAQSELYRRYIKFLLSDNRSEDASQVTIFGWLAVLTLLTNHPRCFRQKLLTPPKPKKSKGNIGLHDGDSASATESGSGTPLQAGMVANTEQLDGEATTAVLDDENVPAIDSSEVEEILNGFDDEIDPQLSAKVGIFLSLLNYSLECRDKVLVFSSSIPTLEYLNELLKSQDQRFGRIDGQVTTAKRMQILEEFHNDDFDIMLVSTKAGGVGLNIQGANRVFIFDFGFNPTYEEQAIGRAYRLGQTKPVFVYRFVAGGTFETNLYDKQLFKSSLAQRVVDKKNPRRHGARNSREYLYEPKPVAQEDLKEWLKEWAGKDPKVLERLLDQHGPDEDGKTDTLIRGIQTMETLQEEAMDAPLDEEEQNEVRLEIEQARSRTRSRRPILNTGPAPPSGLAAATGSHSLMVSLPVSSTPNAFIAPPSTSAGPSGHNHVPRPHPLGGLPLTQHYSK